MGQLVNVTTGEVIATNVERPATWWAKGIGLLRRAKVAPDEGIWIDACNAVHTVGMRTAIDLFFLDGQGRVLRIVSAARPFRLMIACPAAKSVVELGADRTTGRDVLLNDRLALV